jgi:Fe-S oxidoreductase
VNANTLLDSGCCGPAGSFGFHPGHIDIADSAGEQVLFPAVRQASKDPIMLTNGFTCREQIRHGTRREAMHLTELLALACGREWSSASRYCSALELGTRL